MDSPLWSPTSQGGVIEFLAPNPSQFVMHDISLSLSRIPRWNGHTLAHLPAWNVAEHSILVAGIARRQGANPCRTVMALLHDGHEAFTGDLVSPFKYAIRALLADYGIGRANCPVSIIQGRLQVALHASIGLPMPSEADTAAIHTADMTALAIERKQLTVPESPSMPWQPMPEPLADIVLVPCEAPASHLRFMAEFRASMRAWRGEATGVLVA